MAEQQKTAKDTDREYLMLGLRIVGEFGAIIAVPVVVLTLVGKWLDQRYGTRPLFLMAGFALAAAITAVSIVRKAKKFGEEYKSIEDEKIKRSRDEKR